MLNILKISILLIITLITKNQFSDAMIFPFDDILSDRNCLKRQCFEELGCFSTQSFIDEIKELLTSSTKLVDSVQTLLTLKQLLSICPMSPEVMNVTFLLFTKELNESQRFGYNPSEVELKTSAFSSNRRTAFIIHGYTGYYEECARIDCWMAKMKNIFMGNDYNVIAVDWSTPASDVNYFNSAFNTQIVGSIVAFFIKRLIHVFGVKPDAIHVVGHSLGAHVSGFAGKKFDTTNKIGQISGCDPAGPGFSKNRLSQDDANLVVVIHTSAGVLKNVDENIGEHPFETFQLSGMLGCPDPLGHFDFWPNGGNGQPGCEKTTKDFIGDVISGGLSGLVERFSCSHQRANQLPTAQQQTECHMIGYQCDSYADFNDGKCVDCGADGLKCKPLEFNFDFWTNSNNWRNGLKSVPNNYYFKTSESEPFCLFHYQISVSVEESSEGGQITLKLIGQKEVEVVFSNPVLGFKSDEVYTQLITDTQSWGQITEAVVGFDNNIIGKLENLNPLLWRKKNSIKVDRITIKFMSHIDPEIREKYSSELTPDYESFDDEIYSDLITFLIK